MSYLEFNLNTEKRSHEFKERKSAPPLNPAKLFQAMPMPDFRKVSLSIHVAFSSTAAWKRIEVEETRDPIDSATRLWAKIRQPLPKAWEGATRKDQKGARGALKNALVQSTAHPRLWEDEGGHYAEYEASDSAEQTCLLRWLFASKEKEHGAGGCCFESWVISRLQVLIIMAHDN